MTNKINISKKFSGLCLAIIALFLTFSVKLSASEPQDDAPVIVQEGNGPHAVNPHAKGGEEKVNISEVAFEHILDAHSWHFWGEHEGAVSMPLPVILKTNNGIVCFISSEFHHDVHGTVVVEKNGERFVNFEEKIYYASAIPNEHGQFLETTTGAKGEIEVLNATPLDFSITKNVTQMLLSALILFLLFTSIAKAYKKQGVTSAPKGKQSFFEPLIVFVRDDIAKGNIGHGSDKFVPYLLTVFFLILINNVFGLIPIGANLTGNIAFTLVLATFTLIIVNINGNKNYWSHIFLPHAPKAIWPILIPIEIVGILTKPFALMIRLFANIAAGHIIVISLIGLIFIFKSYAISPVSVAFALFIDVLECLVAFLQAYIFTMLTALFIGSAVADHNEDGMHTTDDEQLAEAKH
ncbi:MAG: F0F1 ATP synthase subunit A [Bacteroidota bacterium]